MAQDFFQACGTLSVGSSSYYRLAAPEEASLVKREAMDGLSQPAFSPAPVEPSLVSLR